MYVPRKISTCVRYSFKIMSHSLDNLEFKSSTCQVNLLISINGSYLVETEAQRNVNKYYPPQWFLHFKALFLNLTPLKHT